MSVHNFSSTHRKWVTEEQMDRLKNANRKAVDMLCDEMEDIVDTHNPLMLPDIAYVKERTDRKKGAAQSALLALRVQGILEQCHIDPKKERGNGNEMVSKFESQVTDAISRFSKRSG
jgi:hypothetical protein